MKNAKSITELANSVNATNELEVQNELKHAGYYERNHSFPLASLQFELTSHCNMACKHCYNNSGVSNCPDKMTAEKWIAFAEYLVLKGGVFECLISGGEPLLLGDKLFRIMDILHENGTIFF